VACSLSYNQKGEMSQSFICNSNALKVGKMSFFLTCRARLSLVSFTPAAIGHQPSGV